VIDLTGRVAIVTGAGGGLGRCYAQLLAARGARVVVNDLGPGAEAVAREILAAGGQARAETCSVTDADAVGAMVRRTRADWGRVDILVNNAGMIEVHLMGAFHCTRAVWETMRAQKYGRIVMTTSSSGLYGNFGQSNYGAAKMALAGLMQTLAIEGVKYGIRVNCIAPTAATQMTQGILPADQLNLLRPELVAPGILALVAESAPTRTILCAGAGSFEAAHITLTQGLHVAGDPPSPEELIARWAEVVDRREERAPEYGFAQSELELRKAGYLPPPTKGA